MLATAGQRSTPAPSAPRRSRSSTGAVRWLSPRQTRRCTCEDSTPASVFENASCARSESTSGGRSRTPSSWRTARSAPRRSRPPRGRRSRSSLPPSRPGPTDVDRFTHGTTIATNALLERRGARTALVTNEGFEHVLHLRRQTRAHLYRPCVEHPPPLVPLERCVGVRGRTGPDGRARPARPRHPPGGRRRGDRRLAALLVPRQRAGARRCRRAAAPLPGRARRRLARGRTGVP